MTSFGVFIIFVGIGCVVYYWSKSKTAVVFSLGAIMLGALVAGAGSSSGISSDDTSTAYSDATPRAAVQKASRETDSHKIARYMQNWATRYTDNEGDHLFTGVVSVDDGGTTFKLSTDSGTWSALGSDEQEMVKRNASNAVSLAYCMAGHSGLVPGLGVKFIDDSGETVDWVVTGPGNDCSDHLP